MLEIDKQGLAAESDAQLTYRVVAIGSAGSNVLDRGALDGLGKEHVCAVNTDVQSLSAAVAGRKLQIGRQITRGLGTGGDPELGLAAAEDAAKDIEQLCQQADLLFLCAGLGGGTGSGAAPLVAKAGRDAGALVIAFVTLPFQFEGRRRNEQALHALAELEASCDAVVCFENDRMAELSDVRVGIHEAFANSDRIVSQSIRSIIDFTMRPALMKVGISELIEVLHCREARCVFGYGEGSGTSAVHDALAAALKCPLMDRGKMLREAASVLVQITGGRKMTFAEVQGLMKALGKHLPESAQVFLGVASDERLEAGIRLTIISAFGDQATPRQARKRIAPVQDLNLEVEEDEALPDVDDAPDPVADDEAEVADDLPLLTGASETEPQHAPKPIVQGEAHAARQEPFAAPSDEFNLTGEKQGATQEAFQFETVSRGRFDKIEPTIIDGEDLDIPTFMRKNVRL